MKGNTQNYIVTTIRTFSATSNEHLVWVPEIKINFFKSKKRMVSAIDDLTV